MARPNFIEPGRGPGAEHIPVLHKDR